MKLLYQVTIVISLVLVQCCAYSCNSPSSTKVEQPGAAQQESPKSPTFAFLGDTKSIVGYGDYKLGDKSIIKALDESWVITSSLASSNAGNPSAKAMRKFGYSKTRNAKKADVELTFYDDELVMIVVTLPGSQSSANACKQALLSFNKDCAVGDELQNNVNPNTGQPIVSAQLKDTDGNDVMRYYNGAISDAVTLSYCSRHFYEVDQYINKLIGI